MYYRACKLDPKVEKLVAAPELRNSRASGPPPRMDGPRRMDELTCYGCGQTGHRISNCAKMNEYLSRGVVTKDAQGRIVGKDGSRIPRDYQEPFAQAIERMLQPRTNFVTLAAGTTPVPTLRYPSDESDFWENARAYPATRSRTKDKDSSPRRYG